MNNRKSTNGRNRQNVRSAPERILVGSYTTKSGDIKNRYKVNPDSKIIKSIIHAIA